MEKTTNFEIVIRPQKSSPKGFREYKKREV
jgi:hypothetical protein